MNISRAGEMAVHKAKEQAKYLNAGGSTTEVRSTMLAQNDAFSQKLSDVFRREHSDLIHGLSELSDADRKEIAMNSYFQMQGRVVQAIRREENDIRTFNSISAEKAGISALLEKAEASGGIDGADGSETTPEELKDRLAKVQEKMDAFLAPYGRNEDGSAKTNAFNDSVKKDFAAYASVFAGVTGLSSDALEASSALTVHKTDRDESNYLQKANESLNELKKQSDGLTSLKKDFLGIIGEDPESERMSEEAMVKLAVFEFFRETFAYGGDQKQLEETLKSMSLLNTTA
ncbi:MAG: hypothetical protein K5876_01375 [Ruminiclostridium sp.]|nr:hypothetical protein [Ruminiclostridium sp.]